MNIHGLTITAMLKDMIKCYCVWKYIQFIDLIIETITFWGHFAKYVNSKKGNQKITTANYFFYYNDSEINIEMYVLAHLKSRRNCD